MSLVNHFEEYDDDGLVIFTTNLCAKHREQYEFDRVIPKTNIMVTTENTNAVGVCVHDNEGRCEYTHE